MWASETYFFKLGYSKGWWLPTIDVQKYSEVQEKKVERIEVLASSHLAGVKEG